MSEENEIPENKLEEAGLRVPEVKENSETPEDEEQRKQRVLATLQHQVAMLLDELKKLFAPIMLLTFIARSVEDPTCYSFLSEEKNNDDLIKMLQNMKPPKPIERPSLDVVN